jgi:hypothetical protein
VTECTVLAPAARLSKRYSDRVRMEAARVAGGSSQVVE